MARHQKDFYICVQFAEYRCAISKWSENRLEQVMTFCGNWVIYPPAIHAGDPDCEACLQKLGRTTPPVKFIRRKKQEQEKPIS